MDAKSKRRDDVLSSLNMVVEGLNIAEKLASITPAKAVFSTVNVILTMIRDSMINEDDYVELGLACNTICTALDRGLKGKRPGELSDSVLDAIHQLMMTVSDIRSKITKRSEQNPISRAFHAKNDSQTIASWRSDLNRILLVFNTELGLNIHVTVSDICDGVTKTFTVVADTHTVVADTHTVVADTHTVVADTHTVVADTHTVVADIHTTVADTYTVVSVVADTHTVVADTHAIATDTHAIATDTHAIVADMHTIVANVQRDVAETHAMVSDIRHKVLETQEGTNNQFQGYQTSISSESPPPAPRACFGRSELIEKVVDLAENLAPIALIGPGGIGKTSIALTVLHHGRIKRRFGANRRFVRCDQLPASCAHLLSRLSKVIGAGIDNPEDLASLRPFLSSREMLIVLDNAECILDPGGADGQEIYAIVEELSQLDNICLCITSRVSTVPSDCETLEVPTLLIDDAREAFYHIYKNFEWPDLVDNILDQLDFHPLSITLLATVAHRNKWDTTRLAREWERQRTRMLQTKHIKSLAATIEFSLTSPMFQELGPDARALLEVIAFFPQGVDENNVEWLLPTTPDATNIFDTFCILSLTHRNNSFVTMLAPLRDHLRPKDPRSSPLLSKIKERYFTRLSVDINPNKREHGEARWITSEDVNVEHLLDAFTTIDANSGKVWVACINFMKHLVHHKNRLIALRPKIEALPDDHRHKPDCLFHLSRLFKSVGNHRERRRLLTHTLMLWRERGNEFRVARTLRCLSDANRNMGFRKKGIQLAKEALEIYERLGDTVEQARTLKYLAFLLSDDKQLDAAGDAASHAINLLSEKNQQFLVCELHRVLGNICRSKGETRNAINHFEVVLDNASSFNRHDQLFWAHYCLAVLFLDEDRFNDAHEHIEHAKSHAVNRTYKQGRAMKMQAELWYKQRRLEEAKSEALRAANVYEKLGAVQDLGICRELLQQIETGEPMNKPGVPGKLGDDGWVTEPK